MQLLHTRSNQQQLAVVTSKTQLVQHLLTQQQSQKSTLIRTWDSWTASVEEFVTPANKPISANLAKEVVVSTPVAKKPVASEPISSEPVASEPAAKEADPSSAEPNGQYALIVGAFAENANAERLASDLKESGYPAEVLDAKVGLKKVALRTFASEDAARKAKAQLKGDFPAIWIYHE